MFARIVALLIPVVLVFSTEAVRAQATPSGSYQQSCTDVHVSGGRLRATCSAPNGQRITSSTSSFCMGDIGNVSGYLRCNGSGGEHSGPAPSGSYQQSCRDVHVSGDRVSANCSAPNGQRITSSTSSSCGGDIGNVGGYLRCNGSGAEDSDSIPSGSYLQSCRDVHLDGSRLSANCSAPNGHRITSSTSSICFGDIGNVSGYLRCMH